MSRVKGILGLGLCAQCSQTRFGLRAFRGCSVFCSIEGGREWGGVPVVGHVWLGGFLSFPPACSGIFISTSEVCLWDVLGL